MATPFVAGQAALIHSRAPQATAPRYRAADRRNGAAARDALNPAFAGRLGQGRIDIGASLEYLATKGFPTSGRGILSGSCIGAVAPEPTATARLLLPLLVR